MSYQWLNVFLARQFILVSINYVRSMNWINVFRQFEQICSNAQIKKIVKQEINQATYFANHSCHFNLGNVCIGRHLFDNIRIER